MGARRGLGHPVITAGKRSNQRRAAIVAATLRVIARSGADAVTHRAVAAEAGVSLASTTYYFDSKDALVHEALELVIDRSVAVVAEHTQVAGPISLDELVERLVRLTEAQLEDDDAPLVAQFELVIEAARRPALRPLAERWESAYMESLSTLVEASGVAEPAQVMRDPHDPARRQPARTDLPPPRRLHRRTAASNAAPGRDRNFGLTVHWCRIQRRIRPCGRSSTVEHRPSKPLMAVRFRSPALVHSSGCRHAPHWRITRPGCLRWRSARVWQQTGWPVPDS